MTSIFLSHSSKDKFFVRELAIRLKEYGIKVWLDEAELNIGDSLIQKIGQAIDEADFLGVVLSRNSIESEWVQRELQLAMQKELRERKVVVLPLLLEPVELPFFLRDKIYADFTDPQRYEDTFPLVLKALGILDKDIKSVDKPRKELEVVTKVSPAEQKLAQFEDIHIIDFDEARSYNPNPTFGLYNMYLKLTRVPPLEWQEIFDAERRFPRHTMWRRAWIEGQHIVVYCVPEELEKYHFRDLREDTKSANEKYRNYLTESAQKEIKDIDKEQEERKMLRNLKGRLGF